jgi:hypothetical protein
VNSASNRAWPPAGSRSTYVSCPPSTVPSGAVATTTTVTSSWSCTNALVSVPPTVVDQSSEVAATSDTANVPRSVWCTASEACGPRTSTWSIGASPTEKNTPVRAVWPGSRST